MRVFLFALYSGYASIRLDQTFSAHRASTDHFLTPLMPAGLLFVTVSGFSRRGIGWRQPTAPSGESSPARRKVGVQQYRAVTSVDLESYCRAYTSPVL